MRINKYLSAKGVCSRREADRLLEAGRITVDGAVAECGQQVDDNNIICIDATTRKSALNCSLSKSRFRA